MTRLALVAVILLAGCGGSALRSGSDVRACVAKSLPAGFVTRVFVSSEEGATSLNYFHGGDETDVTVFPSIKAAREAEAAEARLGDAHDRRVRNVLVSGGGRIEAAVRSCAG